MAKTEKNNTKQKNDTGPLAQASNQAARKALLEGLSQTMSELYALCQNMECPETKTHEAWTVKDILGHITFWHESFARNVRDLAAGREPSPLKGTYREINQRSMDEMKDLTAVEIMRKLQAAHRIIEENILSEKLEKIPYRKGSRDYTPEEHLEIVNGHITEHMQAIEKAK